MAVVEGLIDQLRKDVDRLKAPAGNPIRLEELIWTESQALLRVTLSGYPDVFTPEQLANFREVFVGTGLAYKGIEPEVNSRRARAVGYSITDENELNILTPVILLARETFPPPLPAMRRR